MEVCTRLIDGERYFRGQIDLGSIEVNEGMDGDIKWIEFAMDEEQASGERVWVALNMKEALQLVEKLSGVQRRMG